MADLATRALAVLGAAEPRDKVALTRALAGDWRAGKVAPPRRPGVPDRPARPARPALVRPGAVKRRKIGTAPAGRIALLHAVAQIELNAIDLAWDMVARFAGNAMPRAFADDWAGIAADEAEHFALLDARLEALGARYGDLPAHDGLWEAACRTAHDLLARLAVVPMVLEARGLDVTPPMIARLDLAGDRASADVLRRIYAEEVAHVAAGTRWFGFVCAQRGLEPMGAWRGLIRRYCDGVVRPPFNDDARGRAGMPRPFYAA